MIDLSINLRQSLVAMLLEQGALKIFNRFSGCPQNSILGDVGAKGEALFCQAAFFSPR
jgi:hypothetical protein